MPTVEFGTASPLNEQDSKRLEVTTVVDALAIDPRTISTNIPDGGAQAWMTMVGASVSTFLHLSYSLIGFFSFLAVFCSSGYLNAFGVYQGSDIVILALRL